jgi:hypothetical protein
MRIRKNSAFSSSANDCPIGQAATGGLKVKVVPGCPPGNVRFDYFDGLFYYFLFLLAISRRPQFRAWRRER